MTIKSLLIGILIGAALTLALGAVTSTSRGQVAVTYDPANARVIVVTMDASGGLYAVQWPVKNVVTFDELLPGPRIR